MRFRIALSEPLLHMYEVIRFTPEIYFARSVSSNHLPGSLKGVSIWKTEENWISSSGNDENLVRKIGSCIDDQINKADIPPFDGSVVSKSG